MRAEAESLPGSLNHQHRPTGAFLRSDMSHSEPLVRLPHFGFERPGDAGENESATTPHTSNKDRRHLDQRSGEHVRQDERPGSTHEHRVRRARAAVDPPGYSSAHSLPRLPTHPHRYPGRRLAARPSSTPPKPARPIPCQRRGRSREPRLPRLLREPRCTVPWLDDVRFQRPVESVNLSAAGGAATSGGAIRTLPTRTARGLSSQTDPSSRATAGETSTLAHAQGFRHGIRRHTIRNDGRKPVINSLDIERAQLHEAVQGVLRWVKDINAVGHLFVAGRH